ncbi:MAG: 50S ribosomal protein L11 methyltransferase [Bacteroides sp.]|nr:50S ribosomal protein L11 methyltransferase [Roseburia sp.]MCM1347558.1 50S ribosomal protein L11 methyltransferase [Bacteroides sp.]MCM1420996.1 50S ribosomal protein L11 methyltransferase [Bacteroides sp.]
MDYLVAHFNINPVVDDARDVLAALLCNVGFETFEPTDSGIDAFVQKDVFCKESTDDIAGNFFMPGISVDYEVEQADNRNWNEEWENNSFKPIVVDGLCVIHGTAHENIPELPYDIVINPRMAFGSGTHDTTQMLVRFLLQSDFSGQTVLDMGCGTCILGIAMSMRNADAVVAIDIDNASVENALDNCRINGVENVRVIHGDASAIPADIRFDTIVANIHRNILIRDLPCYADAMNCGGHLYMSGFYTADMADIVSAAETLGFALSDTATSNDWCVLKFCKVR